MTKTKLDKEIQEGLYDPKAKGKGTMTQEFKEREEAMLRIWNELNGPKYQKIAKQLKKERAKGYDPKQSHVYKVGWKAKTGFKVKSFWTKAEMDKQVAKLKKAGIWYRAWQAGTDKVYDPSQRIFASDGIRGEIFKSNVKKNIHGTDKPYELIITMDIGLESPNWVRTYQERFKTIAKAQKEAMKIFTTHKKKSTPRGYDPKPIYKIGDKVYSYQNPDEPAEIIRVIPSTEKGYAHKYILRIKTKAGSHNSKWINEESLSSRHYDPKASALPPTRWYEAMVKGIKKSSDVGNPYAIVKSIWAKLSLAKKAEIKAREKKGEHFKYDLPLPVDKPTKGTGTVRMIKPFKLAEVQVNLSVKDYLTARASGLFQRMKRGDGTTALVARCKAKTPQDKNVNIFVDKAGK